MDGMVVDGEISEVDPELAAHAQRALRATGHEMTVVTGGRRAGVSTAGRYDRVIATASVQRVLYPWIPQTRPGGRVITPWGNAYHNGAVLSLTVAEDSTAPRDLYRRIDRLPLVARRG